jgi:hypothetical protein
MSTFSVSDIVDNVAASLGIVTDMGRLALEQALVNLQLFDRKQQDYGPGNIAAFGELGVLVRANDKIERMKNLQKTGRMAAGAANESVADSWDDLANYGLIGKLCHAGLWK